MKKNLLNHLSRNDLVELMSLSHQSLSCRDYHDLKSLVLKLKNILYFENAVCAQGNVLELLHNVEAPNIDVFNISYPDRYLDLYFEKEYYYADAVFCEFVMNLSPVNWMHIDNKLGINYPAAVMALDFNMNDGWTHGTVDPSTMNSAVFFLGGPSAEHGARSEKILEYIIPFLCEAYKRLLKKGSEPCHNFTPREIEVLNWLKEGKSSWDISRIIKCSKRTVDFHVSNIKKKLNAVSRTQAVALALQNKIISF